jgi:hypothetical protein
VLSLGVVLSGGIIDSCLFNANGITLPHFYAMQQKLCENFPLPVISAMLINQMGVMPEKLSEKIARSALLQREHEGHQDSTLIELRKTATEVYPACFKTLSERGLISLGGLNRVRKTIGLQPKPPRTHLRELSASLTELTRGNRPTVRFIPNPERESIDISPPAYALVHNSDEPPITNEPSLNE